jgi:hypothetical protein
MVMYFNNVYFVTALFLMNVLRNEFMKKICDLTALTSKVNLDEKEKILNMTKHHTIEIDQQYHEKDDHWAVETGDLIILCMELLMLENKNINEILTKCLPRFQFKLLQLEQAGGEK